MLASVVAGAVAFTLPSAAPPMLSASHQRVRMSAPPQCLAESVLLAGEVINPEIGGINPVFILLGALPVVATGAFFLVSKTEEATKAIRMDPANACRLGYTADEVAKMEELTRLRYEADLKDFNDACAEAEKNGTAKPDGRGWYASKAGKSEYFDGQGGNERPTMI